MPCSGAASISSGGRRSSRQRRRAPIWRSGSAIRSTGRRRIESSPSSVQVPPPAPRASPAAAAAACRRCRRRSPPCAAPRRPTPRTRIVGSHRLRSTPLDLGARAPRPQPGSSGCRPRRGSPRSPSPPRPSRRSARRGGRSTCRRAGAASRAAGPTGRSGPLSVSVAEHGDGVAQLADQRGCALGLFVAGDPERDRAGGHVRRRVERHVLDVDAGLAQRQGQLGDRAGAIGDDDAQLAQRAAGQLGLEQAAAILAGGGVPGGDGVAVAARGSARPPRAAARRRRRSPRRRPRGWSRRCPPRSPGWSRRPGSCRGSSAPPRASAPSHGSARPPPGRRKHVGDHMRQVADRRHQAVVSLGVDRLRPGAEVGDRALQAVVEQTAGALGRGQVPAGPLEEVGAGVLDPGGLGPGQRMAADEALVVAERGDELALGRAGVGDDAVGAAGVERRRGRARAAPPPGAAQKTTSAPSQASATEPAARSIAPSATARSSVAGSGSKPTTSAPSSRPARPARSSRRSGRRRGPRSSSAAPGPRPPPPAGRAPRPSGPSRCRRR